MYIRKDIMLVSQNSEHNGVCRCNLCLRLLTSLTNSICPSLTAALKAALSDLPGNQHGKIVAAEPPALLADGKETKNHRPKKSKNHRRNENA